MSESHHNTLLYMHHRSRYPGLPKLEVGPSRSCLLIQMPHRFRHTFDALFSSARGTLRNESVYSVAACAIMQHKTKGCAKYLYTYNWRVYGESTYTTIFEIDITHELISTEKKTSCHTAQPKSLSKNSAKSILLKDNIFVK